MYIRFVVAERDKRSDQSRGIFTALYALETQGALSLAETTWFRDIERWLNNNLAEPDKLSWSSRPNARKRAITWLKLSATEHVRHLRDLAELLKHKDIVVEELRTDRPGYIVYEDEHQVSAIPFVHETF